MRFEPEIARKQLIQLCSLNFSSNFELMELLSSLVPPKTTSFLITKEEIKPEETKQKPPSGEFIEETSIETLRSGFIWPLKYQTHNLFYI